MKRGEPVTMGKSDLELLASVMRNSQMSTVQVTIYSGALLEQFEKAKAKREAAL